MTKTLEEKRNEWLAAYFVRVGLIWDEYRRKKMSMKERDELLMWYRRKLWECREANRRSHLLQERPKPKNEERWLSEVKI